MRVLFVVLLVLNLFAFASGQGWLGRSGPAGEPERLSNQLAPERIVLQPGERTAPPKPAAGASEIPPAAAEVVAPPPAAANGNGEPLACVAYTGLAEKQADALAAAAQSVDSGWQVDRSTTSTPTAWWVRIPPEGGREGADRKVAELRALGITEYFIVQEAGANQFAVSLGLFKTEAKAEQHLAFLRTKRVRGAGVTPRSAAVHRVEIRGPAAALASFDNSRAAAQAGAVKTVCNP